MLEKKAMGKKIIINDGEVSKNDSHKTPTKVHIGHRLGTIALINSSIVQLSPQDYDGKTNIFGIISHLSKKMYVLKTETQKESMDWMRAIKRILQQKRGERSEIEGYLSLNEKKNEWFERVERLLFHFT